MKRYDRMALSRPDTYEGDPALVTLARRVAERYFESVRGRMGLGAFKAQVLAGQHPDLMLTAVQEVVDRADAATTAAEEAHRRALVTVPALTLPPGWTATVGDTHVQLRGPYVEDLVPRLHRVGAWDEAARLWRIPVAQAKSLTRIFANAARAAAVEADATQAATHAALVRWLSYVEEKAATGYVYQRGIDECRTRGIAAHPDLTMRLNSALTTAARVAAERRAQPRPTPAVSTPPHHYTSAPSRRRILFPLSEAPELHVPMRFRDQIVVFTDCTATRRIHGDDPSTDGEHLLGSEGTRGVLCTWREATPDEIAQLVGAEQTAAAARATRIRHRTEFRELRQHIQSHGTRPTGRHEPQGRTVVPPGSEDTLFIITETAIWFLQPNGQDGDDFSQNNVPGCLGWCIPFDETIAARLDALARPA